MCSQGWGLLHLEWGVFPGMGSAAPRMGCMCSQGWGLPHPAWGVFPVCHIHHGVSGNTHHAGCGRPHPWEHTPCRPHPWEHTPCWVRQTPSLGTHVHHAVCGRPHPWYPILGAADPIFRNTAHSRCGRPHTWEHTPSSPGAADPIPGNTPHPRRVRQTPSLGNPAAPCMGCVPRGWGLLLCHMLDEYVNYTMLRPHKSLN